jgi:hypothetical protein
VGLRPATSIAITPNPLWGTTIITIPALASIRILQIFVRLTPPDVPETPTDS